MKLTNDFVFKNFSKNPNSRWYIVALTSEILDLDQEDVDKNLVIMDSELFKYKEEEKGHLTDTVVKINNYIINFEMNNEYYPSIILDKERYLNHLYNVNYIRNSNTPQNIIIQVMINNFSAKEIDNNLLKNIILEKTNKNTKINSYRIIIEYSLVKIKEKWYNKFTLSKLEKLLLLLKLSENFAELEDFVKGDVYMTNLEKDKEFLRYIREEMDKAFDYETELKNRYLAIGRYKGEQEGKEEGIKEGLKEGIKKGLKEGEQKSIALVVKEMIRNNIPKETILKVTKIDEQAYQKLKVEVA